MKGILAAAAVALSLFITANAWAQSGQDPAVAPSGAPPGTLKIYPLGPDEAKQIRPPQDCEALRQATEECQKAGTGDVSPSTCDALANQFIACKTGD